jgi:hypothetical protein
MYFDRTGTMISEEAWKGYWADEEYRVLARTDVGDWTVAAWWAGADDGGDRVFRSALLVPPRQAGYGSPLLQEWRHGRAEEALAHHDELVARLRSDDSPATAPTRAEDAQPGCHCH